MARTAGKATTQGPKGSAPKGRALKVYRTAIGFHDAYVAAPSKKAALAAWGTDKDLFARGAADVVDDPALTAEPLAAPGTVIRRTRGSLAEQLAAAGPTPQPVRRSAPADADTDAQVKPSRKAKPQPSPPPRPPKPPRPRPSRSTLDEAEAALAAAQSAADAERTALRAEEEALRKRRNAFERAQRDTLERLGAAGDKARQAYEAAMERWRADT